MKKRDVTFLNQLIDSIEEASLTLRDVYNQKDYERFNKLKKFILQMQKKISWIIK